MGKYLVPSGIETAQLTEDESKELAAKEFAEEVKRLREKHNLTQEQLGKLIKVQQPIMTRIENGTYGVTLDLVNRIAQALHEDRHRLADVYWGVTSSEYSDPNKELLDVMWQLLSDHYQPKLNNPNSRHQPDEQAAKGIEQARTLRGKRKNLPAPKPANEDTK